MHPFFQEGICKLETDTVTWSVDGEEKYVIRLDNVKHIWIEMQRDIPPCLLPVIGERSDCRSPVKDGPPNKLSSGPRLGNGPNGSDGQVTDDDVLKDIIGSRSPETKTACEAMVVEFPSDTNKNPDDPSSSPDEEWDDEHTSVRVDFHIFCNEGVRVDDDEDDSSPNDDDDEENNDAKITSDLKAGNKAIFTYIRASRFEFGIWIQKVGIRNRV